MSTIGFGNAHSTGDGNGSWDTRRVALTALFVAAVIATSYISIPIFPAAPFLKYDPSGIICLLAGLLYGARTGCIVATLPWIIRAFTNPAGALMSFVIGICGVLTACLIYKKVKNRTGLILSLSLAGIVSVIAAIVMNLIVTPAFSGVSVESVLAMIVPILLPFNILKFALNSAVAGIAFLPLSKILK